MQANLCDAHPHAPKCIAIMKTTQVDSPNACKQTNVMLTCMHQTYIEIMKTSQIDSHNVSAFALAPHGEAHRQASAHTEIRKATQVDSS